MEVHKLINILLTYANTSMYIIYIAPTRTFIINNEPFGLLSVWKFWSIKYCRNCDVLRDVCCCSLFPPDASVLYRVEWRGIRRTLEQSWEGGRTYASNAFIQGSCVIDLSPSCLPPTPTRCVLGALFVLSLVIFTSLCLNGSCHIAAGGEKTVEIENPNLFFFSSLPSASIIPRTLTRPLITVCLR